MTRMLAFVPFLVLSLAAGCASHLKQPSATPGFSAVERPPTLASGLREIQVRERAQELIKNGQFVFRTDALKAAEQEIPPSNAEAWAKWERQHNAALKAQAAQTAFESELAAMYRK